MIYQGWANAQTWCVALTIDNDRTKLDRVLALIRQTPINEVKTAIQTQCFQWRGDIFHMATWAWPEAYQSQQVDWAEIVNHYITKIKEEGSV